ncbi:uncharacterized protein LOC109508309 [Hippocampus comes]|uniref:uncharacterized protein LOC109508309 n=1 Tax=Hippocampus comes TaxID=109280 RepID=UPI00094E85B4|nr:PREDICTED: uncharacterized protein LOC109508309 [Hippocampus comes]
MEPKRELVSPAVPRRAVQPPSSHRTLQQPSRMAEYEAAGLGLSPPRQYLIWAPIWDRDSSSDSPASYYEATPWWGAIPRTARLLGPAWSGLRLNTPPPLMCTSPAPPNRADPFPRGPHAFRVLGGPTWMPCCDGHPGRTVVQLSAEEDLAVTCLLKLRYRDPEDPQVGLQNIMGSCQLEQLAKTAGKLGRLGSARRREWRGMAGIQATG